MENFDAEQTTPIVIGSRCIFRVGNRFFLLTELRSSIPGVGFLRVVISCITAAQAAALQRAGVGFCSISNTVPVGVGVRFQCTFVVGGQAFLIFVTQTPTGITPVIVRSPLCTVICPPAGTGDEQETEENLE